MIAPTTELDARFSEPGAVATTWDETRRAIESAGLFWICTVRRDGRPHITPLVAAWLDRAIHFSTGAEEQKARNLEHNPHVILMTGCNGWQERLDDAVRVTESEVLERLAEAWSQKWDGRWRFETRDGALHHDQGPANVFAVRPRRCSRSGRAASAIRATGSEQRTPRRVPCRPGRCLHSGWALPTCMRTESPPYPRLRRRLIPYRDGDTGS